MNDRWIKQRESSIEKIQDEMAVDNIYIDNKGGHLLDVLVLLSQGKGFIYSNRTRGATCLMCF